jgi:quinohemoprotein amine dehydrogenase
MMRFAQLGVTAFLLFAGVAWSQTNAPEQGIPVTDPMVVAKCGSCHTRDEHGIMQRISFERATPEGWQEALKRMILLDGVTLTPVEARAIVRYLSTEHGLAPDEAKPILYDVERRIHTETAIPNDAVGHACARCHNFARALSWRRSAEDWKQLAEMHATRFKLPVNNEAIAFLTKAAPLHTPAWDAWIAGTHTPNLAGRWLVSASMQGRGKYYGEMQVAQMGDDFNTTVHLTSVDDGSTITRTGRSVVYGTFAWRGRSQGAQPATVAPDDPNREAREAMWIAPDQSTGEGRWFWGQYQEFGFDVKMRRAASGTTLLMVYPTSLKTGSEASRIRLIGDQLPAQVTPADLHFGPGVTVRRIVSHTPDEVIAEVDVASNATLGKRDVRLGNSEAPGAVAVYDRVDYIKVMPESALAAFADATHPRGYDHFEAIGYQRGADGKLHTADDLELGPLDTNELNWSLEVFYQAPGSSTDFVGNVSPTGFFTPAPENPNNNFDVWVVATAKNESKIDRAKNGRPLVGKAYLVVTVPMYTFNGHRYVRDLDRWIDDGPAQ